MPKILKSALAELSRRGIIPSFEEAIQRHIVELTAHAEHQQIVDKQGPLPRKPEWADYADATDPAAEFAAANFNYAKVRREYRDPYPRPTAHPWVDACVKFEDGKFAPDFEIVNDDPKPEDILRAKKDELLHNISDNEQVAVRIVQLPPGKQRLVDLISAEIATREARRAEALWKEAADNAGGDPAKLPSYAEIEKKILAERLPQHVDHLAGIESRAGRLAEIHRQAAKAMSTVEDLTLDNIDKFVIPTFDA
jgi:hypothetical protein